MKAAVIKEPGVIVVEDVAAPAPGKGEVLLNIDACALCGTDQRVLKGEKHVDVPIVGHEIASTVAAVGEGVEGVKVGERYAVQTVIGCNDCPMCALDRQNLCKNGFKAIGYQWNGGFAEQMVMPAVGVAQGNLIPLPEGMKAEAATLIEPLSCCVNGMHSIPFEDLDTVAVFGGGIIGVLNGLVAKARGAKKVVIFDVAQDRLDLLKSLGLPFDGYVNSREEDPVDWIKSFTNDLGADAVIVAASVKQLVSVGMKMLACGGHLSVFAGMPKSDPTVQMDLNLIHYPEVHLHGANSSVQRHYLEACELISSGKMVTDKLVTHTFSLDDFNEAVATQANPASGALKVVIKPVGIHP